MVGEVAIGKACFNLGLLRALLTALVGFSPDPYLTGAAVEQTIQGMQVAGVQACVKREYRHKLENLILTLNRLYRKRTRDTA